MYYVGTSMRDLSKTTYLSRHSVLRQIFMSGTSKALKQVVGEFSGKQRRTALHYNTAVPDKYAICSTWMYSVFILKQDRQCT